jgi:leucyl/phenylalanyl-tRNA--protein transferase
MRKRGPFWLGARPRFPPPSLADENGLLALGGDLGTERLLTAYRLGIFPWPVDDPRVPLLWFAPDPRFVLRPAELHVARSLRRTLKRREFEIRVDTAFAEVIRACAEARRERGGTWITVEMIEAYSRLHELGWAHCFESWRGGSLAGGIYGIAMGGVFFAESMFHNVSNASKVALVTLVEVLGRRGFELIDCQQQTELLGRFGARPIPRPEFASALRRALSLAVEFPPQGPLECGAGLSASP